jgi:hypothetical protein
MDLNDTIAPTQEPKLKPTLTRHWEWSPHKGRQTQALERKETEILFGGARGGGKTEAGQAWLAEPEYIKHPRFNSLVLRKNYDDLSDWINRARYFYYGIGEIIGKPAEIRWKWGGRTKLGHWGDPSAIGKYLGHEYHKILIEELTESIATEKEYLQLLGSLRSVETTLKPQAFNTSNPGNKGHVWVKKRWVLPANGKTYIDPRTGYSRIYIPATVDDNPTLKQRNPEYVAFLDGLYEPLRSAWRHGDWNVFEGQFFIEFGPHMAEDPFKIERSALEGRLIGSLDSGTTHGTSFGLWWLDTQEYIWHRLMTYLGTGRTINYHAREIFDRIEAFPFTDGFFPEKIYADPSMWTKVKLNEEMTRAPIEEYQDLWADNNKDKTTFVKANNDKVNGCQIMRMQYAGMDGVPAVRYFKRYNTSFEEGIASAITDKNNPEIYAKVDGDDVADEARYGQVAGYSIVGSFRQGEKMKKLPTPLERLLKKSKAKQAEDWYNG